MSDILLVGLASDQGRIRRVVDALHANRLDFWWEAGGPGAEGLAESLPKARCVVLFLTRDGAADAPFLDLAVRAAAEGKAIVARLDKAAVPAALAGVTAIDLSGFKGGKDDLFLIDLVHAADAKAKGIDPPPPRGPVSRATKRFVAIGSVGFVLAATGVGLVADVFGASSGLKEVVSRFDPQQRAAYEAVATCEGLRDFARQNDGYYAALARRRYENPRLVDATERKEVHTEAYAERSLMTPAADRRQAEAAALGVMEGEAAKVCRQNADKAGGALVATRFEPDRWSCDSAGGGVACGVLAQVVCTIDEPVRRQDCGRS